MWVLKNLNCRNVQSSPEIANAKPGTAEDSDKKNAKNVNSSVQKGISSLTKKVSTKWGQLKRTSSSDFISLTTHECLEKPRKKMIFGKYKSESFSQPSFKSTSEFLTNCLKNPRKLDFDKLKLDRTMSDSGLKKPKILKRRLDPSMEEIDQITEKILPASSDTEESTDIFNNNFEHFESLSQPEPLQKLQNDFGYNQKVCFDLEDGVQSKSKNSGRTMKKEKFESKAFVPSKILSDLVHNLNLDEISRKTHENQTLNILAQKVDKMKIPSETKMFQAPKERSEFSKIPEIQLLKESQHPLSKRSRFCFDNDSLGCANFSGNRVKRPAITRSPSQRKCDSSPSLYKSQNISVKFFVPESGKTGISVEQIKGTRLVYAISGLDPQSDVAKLGLLKVGDRIKQICGLNLKSVQNLARVKNILKTCSGEVILQIARKPVVNFNDDMKFWPEINSNFEPTEFSRNFPKDEMMSVDEDFKPFVVGAILKKGNEVTNQEISSGSKLDQVPKAVDMPSNIEQLTGMKKFFVTKRSEKYFQAHDSDDEMNN